MDMILENANMKFKDLAVRSTVEKETCLKTIFFLLFFLFSISQETAGIETDEDVGAVIPTDV